MDRMPDEPRWRVGERVQLQAHIDLTQLGTGVILDVDAKEDGVAKAALVRFEGGPRAGLWYSIGNLKHEPPARQVPLQAPAAWLDPEAPKPLAGSPQSSPRSLRKQSVTRAREERKAEKAARKCAGAERAQLQALAPPDTPVSPALTLGQRRASPTPLARLVGGDPRAETLAYLLVARGGTQRAVESWLRALVLRHSLRRFEAMEQVRRELEARPLWEWRKNLHWPPWLFPETLRGAAGADPAEAATPGVRPGEPSPPVSERVDCLDPRQLILRGWLFPGERMRSLLGLLAEGVEGVSTEREALTWAEGRLRALGWWRPLQLAPAGAPDLLSGRVLRSAIAGVLPDSTQTRLESVLRGAQRAGLVRTQGEAAAWARAWIETWALGQSDDADARPLPDPIARWELIRRGWLLDNLRLRALEAKEVRARERREPKYLADPLAWAYCQIAQAGWLRPRLPSLRAVDPSQLQGLPASLIGPEFLRTLQQALSAGILRDPHEIGVYARELSIQDQEQRLRSALEREDLGAALQALLRGPGAGALGEIDEILRGRE